MRNIKWLVAALAIGCWFNAAQASLVTFDNLNRAIPDDGGAAGLADTRTVNVSLNQIGSVDVLLNIQGTGFGAFNGDLYVSLVHDSGFAVLLNGVGRTATDRMGYGDNGVNVRLSDNGVSGDIHQYRLTLFGNPNTGIAGGTGALTGIWSPDARNVDPNVVTDTSTRTAFLSSFGGLDPNGQWTLYIADTEMGGTGQLVSWGLDFTPIPEVSGIGIAGVLLAFALAGHRIFAMRRVQPQK
jgi:subtilisin-like proprotein convertase family protein